MSHLHHWDTLLSWSRFFWTRIYFPYLFYASFRTWSWSSTHLFVCTAVTDLSFFFSGDFDILIAARTPSNESWRNQPERIMSILNLALQAVGLMRSKFQNNVKKLCSACELGKLKDVAKDPTLRQKKFEGFYLASKGIF